MPVIMKEQCPFLKTIMFVFFFNFCLAIGLAQSEFPFQNPELSIENRIGNLLGYLTLEEKASMMLYNSPAIERLQIPAYNWWNESLHGVGRAGKATVFPQAIGLAATFDEDLVFRVATAISDEARAKHNAARAKGSFQQYTGLSFWSPNVNIFRDPRWGRGQETYGEDPFLTSRIGLSYVKGLQGDDPKYLKTAACAKHFVVHSGPEELRHSFNAIPSEIDFHETYLPAFKALVEGGVETVMCAYNKLYDQPCCGNIILLKDILRKQWGFKGHIVSDCWAIYDFINPQQYVEKESEAALLALEAGVNLNCGTIYNFIPEVVAQGGISVIQLDSLLKPLLRTRFKLGLLDREDASPFAKIPASVVNCEKHRKLAYEAASKSIVLLENINHCLPLTVDSIQKIYVTGPTAADNTVLLGNYNGFSGNLQTLLEGIINKVDVGTVVDYTMGTLLNTDSIFNGVYHASSADAIIASIGNSRMLEGENGDAMLSASGGDRQRICLPENQIEFIRLLRKQAPDKPLIVVVFGGSAIALPEICALADAVLFAWYPGEQGGNAIADILFGNTNPSGKLPLTFYAQLNDLPPFDDYSMQNRTYKYFQGKALFPFGHGLSYSKFDYSALESKKKEYGLEEEIQIEFALTNSSDRAGEEVVQLYLKDVKKRLNRPIKALKGFKRVFLEAGETKQISFIIPVKEFAAWDLDEKDFVVEAGGYCIEIGASSSDIRLIKQIQIKDQ
jgi:beta-glucosidase